MKFKKNDFDIFADARDLIGRGVAVNKALSKLSIT